MRTANSVVDSQWLMHVGVLGRASCWRLASSGHTSPAVMGGSMATNLRAVLAFGADTHHVYSSGYNSHPTYSQSS